ncbi:hypothetical protein M1O17_05190, partial [Dehalococcoidia bacterium]|nr:hypothetical protein [Dehalococcoidia bacterium]
SLYVSILIKPDSFDNGANFSSQLRTLFENRSLALSAIVDTNHPPGFRAEKIFLKLDISLKARPCT